MNKFYKSLLAACILSTLSVNGLASSAYKWTDSNNETNYSQSAPATDRATKVSAPPPSPPSNPQNELERIKKLESEVQSMEDKTKKDQELAEAKSKDEAAKKINCNRAKEHLANMNMKPRERLISTNGETTALSTSDRDAEIKKTEQAIKDFCVDGK